MIYFVFPLEKSDAIPVSQFDLLEADPPQPTETPKTENTVPEIVMVELKGQIAEPGVYELSTDSRVKDAIEAAGGILPSADSKAINLAMKVQDEMSIYIPAVGEEVDVPEFTASSGASGISLVDINIADEAGLTQLPGIGPSKAAAIIAYREENGKFQTIDDLKNVTGIGDKTFEQLKDAITAK